MNSKARYIDLINLNGVGSITYTLGTYSACILMGYVGNIGGVCLAVTRNNNGTAFAVFNLYTGSALVNSNNLKIENTTNGFKLTCSMGVNLSVFKSP